MVRVPHPDGTYTDLTIAVVDIDRGKIRLGISAPRSWQIWRNELQPPQAPPVPIARKEV
jgi:hypothetical protein